MQDSLSVLWEKGKSEIILTGAVSCSKLQIVKRLALSNCVTGGGLTMVKGELR